MVSNKNLALLLIVAVVISLGGTLISLNKIGQVEELRKLPLPVRQTGMATYGGQVDLIISSNASCIVSNNVSFGTAGQPGGEITISTQLNNEPNGFNDCTTAACTGIEIENNGNVNLLVNFTSDKNATGFLVEQTGLSEADFMFKAKNGTGTNEATRPGCVNAELPNWANIPGPGGAATNICANLTSSDSYDTVTMEFNVTLQSDIIAGPKIAVLTINCVQN